MTIGKSVSVMQSMRDEKVKRIFNSRLFKAREEFTSATLAREMMGETPDSISSVLEYMWREGYLIKRISDAKAYYSAKPKSIISLDWRVNIDTHRMIERLNRGY